MNKYIAVDLGAESGRVIVGTLSKIEVVHRFPNRPVRIGQSLFWDILSIFTEIKTGLRAAFQIHPQDIVSIGLDTWGVDYGLLDANGDLLGNLYHYRDSRTDDTPEVFFERIPRREVFEETGVQFMALNTLYQLFAHNRDNPRIVQAAQYVLTLPNLLNYWLTGVMKNEYSHVSTTQLYNPKTRAWSDKLIHALGMDPAQFCDIVSSGTVLGPLYPHVAEEIGAGPGVRVVATACHDTASAVAAVPVVETENYGYLSSGTWSLLGVENSEPIINEASFAYNFTNEGGADGGFRFLKNIIGLWIVQECKRSWDTEGQVHTYSEWTELARQSGPASFHIDVNDPRFLKPGIIDDAMPDRILAYCRESDQNPPKNRAEMVRGVLESLAGLYAKTIEEINDVLGSPLSTLYIIGGGSQNTLLCQLTANAAGIPVYGGPAEATAIGNILIQTIAAGEVSSIAEGREIINGAYTIDRYQPD